MKAIVFGMLCTVLSTTTISLAQAQTSTSLVPQIVAADADPIDTISTDTGTADHFIDLKVQGEPITTISIGFPPGLKVTKGIDVAARSKQPVKASVVVNPTDAIIRFAKPVQPGTTLKIALRGVNGSRSGEDVWLYPVAVRYVGESQNIEIGTARIETYEND